MSKNLNSALEIVAGVTGDRPLILDPKTPLESAREFVRHKYLHEFQRTVRHQGRIFYGWCGTHYKEINVEEIRADICRFLDSASYIVDGKSVALSPSPRAIADVTEMLRIECQLAGDIAAPTWLDLRTHPDPQNVFACANGILDLSSRELHSHSPAFFSLNAVEYRFDRYADPPSEWLGFLHSLWADDHDSITTLQEFFGYALTGNTGQQKAMLLVGAKRSGKGTIARVLTALLGAANVAGPSLSSFSSNFGLAPLIGKPLAIISDARLGGRSDQAVIVERVLSMTGEDRLTIDRKHRDPWTGKLPTRLLILTNELPKLSDASGAFASRFILLRLARSFYGSEDQGLLDRLLPELPAILNWAIAGWGALQARGHFLQPDSGKQEMDAFEDLNSPVGAFIRDHTSVGPGQRVTCAALYAEWIRWCTLNGRLSGSTQTFSRDLKAAIPAVKVSNIRAPGAGRDRYYEGVDILPREGMSSSFGAPPLPRLPGT